MTSARTGATRARTHRDVLNRWREESSEARQVSAADSTLGAIIENVANSTIGADAR